MSTKPWGALPVCRINTIMKCSSEAECIGKESSQLMSKAAELFIKSLSKEGFKLSKNGKKLDYKHVAEVVNTTEKYEFLRDIMPRKITVAEYKKMRRHEAKKEGTSTEGEESESEGSDSDSQ